MLVESYSYERILRGSWQAYSLNSQDIVAAPDAEVLSLWLPRGTPMRWATGTRPLRSDCLQFFWPGRWYMLSAFYAERELKNVYISIIQPISKEHEKIYYTDLDLSILIAPDLSLEVLTQAEFDYASTTLPYDEETILQAQAAKLTVTSKIQLTMGFFTVVPYILPTAVGAV